MKHIILRVCVLTYICMVISVGIYAQTRDDLKLYAEDVRISEKPDAGGFFIYVKKKAGITSVLLTESAETPSRNADTYALRTSTFNSINGDELRVLNEKFIKLPNEYFITDSSYEPDVEGDFGQMFVLFLPYKVTFGYESTRNGVFDLRQGGMYLSIRTFSELYANHAGDYLDNSFYLERIQDTPVPEVAAAPVNTYPNLLPDFSTNTENIPSSTPVMAADPVFSPEEIDDAELAEEINKIKPQSVNDLTGVLDTVSQERYSPETIRSFNDIADNIKKVSANTNSKAYKVEDKNDIVDKIATILEDSSKDSSHDIVILLDTTRSMWDDLSVLKTRLIPTISKIMRGTTYRIGLVLYRDKGEEYITKKIEFNNKLDVVQRDINSLKAGGGGDWPEAVYEALDVAVNNFVWIAKNRTIFIVGDAPPHKPPNTSVDLNQLYTVTALKEITVYPLIVPKRD